MGVQPDVLLPALRVWRRQDGTTGREAPGPPDTSHHRQAKEPSPQKMWNSQSAEQARPASAPHMRDSQPPAALQSRHATTKEVAKVQDQTVQQGVSDTDVHRTSAIRHRQAAADDRDLAERLRKESEADLSLDQ